MCLVQNPGQVMQKLCSLKLVISELPKPYVPVCDSLALSDEVTHETAGFDRASGLGDYYSSHQATSPDLPSRE